MKSLAIIFLFVSSALAQAPPGAVAPAAVNPANDPNVQRARALLQQCIEALGGPAWLSVQDMTQEGRTYSFYHGQPNSVGAPFWRFWKWPDKDRIELTKQRDVVYINNGDKSYEITYKGTAAQEPQQYADYMRRGKRTLEIVLRRWLNEPSTALFYDGPAVAEQKQAESVTLMNGEDAVTLFLDFHSHLPIKKTFVWRDKDRYKNEEAEIFDGWRPEQGIMTAHSIIRARNGEYTNQRFLTKVTYNTGLADSMFNATVTYDPYKTERKK